MSGEAGAGIESTYFHIFYSSGMTVSVAVPPWEKDNSHYISDYFEEANKPFEEKLREIRSDLENLFAKIVEQKELPLAKLNTEAEYFDGAILEDTKEFANDIKEEFNAQSWFKNTQNPVAIVFLSFSTPSFKKLSLTLHVTDVVKRSQLNALKEKILSFFAE